MESKKKIRVLVAKPGLDGHDRGAKVIIYGLREAGMEIIYTGLRQTTEEIIASAIQEDVDVIGLSILSGAHLVIVETLARQMNEKGIDDIPVVVGGVIPGKDIAKLKELGVKEVFTAGTPMKKIVESITENAREKEMKPRG